MPAHAVKGRAGRAPGNWCAGAQMDRIEAAPEVFDDGDRFLDYIAAFDAGATPARIEEILQAVQNLGTSPLIGRPVKGGKYERVIGRGSCGYVALCRHVPELDTEFLPAIRSQRESGFMHDAWACVQANFDRSLSASNGRSCGRSTVPQRRSRVQPQNWHIDWLCGRLRPWKTAATVAERLWTTLFGPAQDLVMLTGGGRSIVDIHQ